MTRGSRTAAAPGKDWAKAQLGMLLGAHADPFFDLLDAPNDGLKLVRHRTGHKTVRVVPSRISGDGHGRSHAVQALFQALGQSETVPPEELADLVLGALLQGAQSGELQYKIGRQGGGRVLLEYFHGQGVEDFEEGFKPVGQRGALIDQVASIADQEGQLPGEFILQDEWRQERAVRLDQLASQAAVQIIALAAAGADDFAKASQALGIDEIQFQKAVLNKDGQ